MKPLRILPAFALLLVAACDGTTPADPDAAFLEGEVGLVVNSTEQSLSIFRLDDPSEVRQVPFGAEAQISPTGISVRGTRALVPLGNAASVALVDLQRQRVERFFTFAGGNATGSAWVNDTTALVANLRTSQVGRFTLGQEQARITEQSVKLVEGPTAIEVVAGRAFVVSSNYDMTTYTARQGTVTALDPNTLEVLGSVPVGINPTAAAVGPDDLLYVLNTGDYASPSTVTVLHPATLAVVHTEERLFAGAGGISIDANGLAYLSSFFGGTLVWDTRTRQFVRGADDPVCAKTAEGKCRGAFDAAVDSRGDLYQTFFGSANKGTKPWVFRYSAGSYELTDSITVGSGFYGPTAIEVRRF